MNAVTFNIPDEVHEQIDRIAEDKGVTVETLLSEMTASAVKEFEARQAFLEIA